MTRKDTIIIASIVNGVLLLVLFITGVKTDSSPKKPQEKVVDLVEPVSIAPAPKQEIKTAQGDEIDAVLRQFSEKHQVKKDDPKIGLAKEIEAITKVVKGQKKASSDLQVTVKKGDVLEKIARAHHTSVKEIMDLNELRSTVLRIGQVLKIPQKKGEAKAPSSSRAEYYTVKSGDSPWTIAVKNQLKVDDLLKLNNLDQEKARHLKPGDQLRIR